MTADDALREKARAWLEGHGFVIGDAYVDGMKIDSLAVLLAAERAEAVGPVSVDECLVAMQALRDVYMSDGSSKIQRAAWQQFDELRERARASASAKEGGL